LLTTASAPATSRSKSARPSGVLISSATDCLPREKVWKNWLSPPEVAQEVGTQAPADVAAQGRGLDLDHLRAQLAQQLGAVGAGGVLLDRHDAHAVQGSVHPLRLFRRMMRRAPRRA
jgi:hypothetical protein